MTEEVTDAAIGAWRGANLEGRRFLRAKAALVWPVPCVTGQAEESR